MPRSNNPIHTQIQRIEEILQTLNINEHRKLANLKILSSTNSFIFFGNKHTHKNPTNSTHNNSKPSQPHKFSLNKSINFLWTIIIHPIQLTTNLANHMNIRYSLLPSNPNFKETQLNKYPSPHRERKGKWSSRHYNKAT